MPHEQKQYRFVYITNKNQEQKRFIISIFMVFSLKRKKKKLMHNKLPKLCHKLYGCLFQSSSCLFYRKTNILYRFRKSRGIFIYEIQLEIEIFFPNKNRI